jgi:hypothetical protein
MKDRPVPIYRIYILTDADLIGSAQETECDDDIAAISAGERLRSEHPWIEIWQGDRMVRRWLPPPD